MQISEQWFLDVFIFLIIVLVLNYEAISHILRPPVVQRKFSGFQTCPIILGTNIMSGGQLPMTSQWRMWWTMVAPLLRIGLGPSLTWSWPYEAVTFMMTSWWYGGKSISLYISSIPGSLFIRLVLLMVCFCGSRLQETCFVLTRTSILLKLFVSLGPR